MDSFVQIRGRAVLAAPAVAWLALGGLALAGPAGKAGVPDQGASQAVVQAPHGAYAGMTVCLSCHEDKGAATKQGPHSRAYRAGSPMSPNGCTTCHGDTKAALGCESCHGPGKAHADAGGDKAQIRRFSSMAPKDVSAVCTSCHSKSSHAMWSGSQHDQRNVGCTTCHDIHAPKGEPLLKASSETQLCATCHRAIANKQLKFTHMPVREGKMTCASCHNVHGATNVKLLRAGGTINEACYTCHAEKRGPTLWEHAPVTENCATCHDPHGSNNDRMLVAKQPFLCQRCHVTSRHPPTVYEGYLLNNSTNANKIFGRSCAACHQQVHGSNAPSGKALLR